MNENPIVKASEIGEYIYCKRAWWLRLNGKLPEQTDEMVKGTEAHETLANDLKQQKTGIGLAMFFIVLGIIFFLAVLSLSLLHII